MRFIVTGLIMIADFILQTTVFDYIEIGGVKPNTFIIILVSFAILDGSLTGAIMGLIGGFAHDIFFSDIIGVNALIYMLLGYSIGFAHEKVYRDSLIVPVIITFISTIALGILTFIYTFFARFQIEFNVIFINKLFPEAVYNSILSIFIYYWILKLHKLKFMGKKWYYRKS